MKRGVLFLTLATAILSSSTAGCSRTNAARQDAPPWELALLSDDWSKAAEACGTDAAIAARPVLRAIKGHAYLVQNRGNESLRLFASISNQPDQDEWDRWTTDFISRNERAAVAWYLRGDAQARRGRWKEAADSFDRALGIRRDWYLALNARGVVLHALNQVDQARADFVAAAEERSDFADAYASRGTLNILANNGRGTESYFRSALNLSHDSPVALDGLGCALYGVQKYQEAKAFFAKIPRDSDLSHLARQNALMADAARLARAVKNAKKAGMSVGRFEMRDRDGDDGPYIYVPADDGGYDVWDESGNWVRHIPPRGERPPKPERPTPPGGEEPPKPGQPTPPAGQPRPGEAGKQDESTAKQLVPPELLPPIPGIDLPPPPIPIPPWESLNQMEKITDNLESRLASRHLTGASTPSGEPAGVSADTSDIRRDAGRWSVVNVYGLLYDVPRALANGKAAGG